MGHEARQACLFLIIAEPHGWAGMERGALVKFRVNQSFFRQRLLSACEFQCCVTGLKSRPLLAASYIIP